MTPKLRKYLCLINEYKYQDGDIIDIITLQNKLKYFQRRRHLMIWHDGSTICNHGHVLFTCSEVYDKAIHLNEEVLQIFGKKVDVQETIEQPQIYIFARCPGSTGLTAYTSTRMKDLDELQTPIVFDKAVDVYDVMRFLKAMGLHVKLSLVSKKVEITFVGFVEFHIIGLLTLHMLHIEIIFPWMTVSRKF